MGKAGRVLSNTDPALWRCWHPVRICTTLWRDDLGGDPVRMAEAVEAAESAAGTRCHVRVPR